LLVAVLGLMLAGVALAVDASLLWQARQELQVAADAASLAAVQQLADDRVLLKRPEVMIDVVQASRHVAGEYAHRHLVLGQPLRLEFGEPARSDVVFGFYDPVTQRVHPAPVSDWGSPYLNTVEVTGRRNRERGNAPGLFFARFLRLPAADVAASATAVLDRQVIGFRPTGGITVPLVPIALLSDPAGLEEYAWETQVDKPLASGGGGRDQYAFDKVNRRWLQSGEGQAVGDGLPEFTLRLPLAGDDDDSNGQVIRLGPSDFRSWVRQVVRGIQEADLAAWDGQLTLSWDGLCPVPEGVLPTGRMLEALVQELRALQSTGEPRAWPLFTPGSDSAPQQPNPGNDVLLRGFVAARIADVQVTEGEDAALILVLQPTVLVTSTALTQPTAENNAYLAKARLLK